MHNICEIHENTKCRKKFFMFLIFKSNHIESLKTHIGPFFTYYKVLYTYPYPSILFHVFELFNIPILYCDPLTMQIKMMFRRRIDYVLMDEVLALRALGGDERRLAFQF